MQEIEVEALDVHKADTYSMRMQDAADAAREAWQTKRDALADKVLTCLIADDTYVMPSLVQAALGGDFADLTLSDTAFRNGLVRQNNDANFPEWQPTGVVPDILDRIKKATPGGGIAQ